MYVCVYVNYPNRKTIQALSMILKHRPDLKDKQLLAEWDLSDKTHEFNPGKNARRGKTLIVVPTIALIQWQMEIQRFTSEGSLSIAVYHGNSRDAGPEMLCNADVVLTTYKILEIEHRKATAGTKIECTICGRKFYPEKLRIHRKYFCGENAQRTEAQARTEVKRRRQGGGGAASAAADSEDESSFDDSEDSSSEDSIAKQKRNIKRGAQSQAPKSTPSKETKKTKTEKINDGKSKASSLKKNIGSSSTANKKKTARGGNGTKDFIISSDDSESAYSPSESASSSEDDVSLESERGGDARKTQKKSNAILKFKVSSSKKPSPAPKSGSKRKAGRDDSDPDAGSEDDSDDNSLEDYIKRATALQSKSKKPDSILHSISWFRIILDEAHLIKDRSTSTAHAAFALVSLNKWCLTGTPLQNRVGELYSLVRFLRCDPHAYYFCKTKNCQCKSLHYVSIFYDNLVFKLVSYSVWN
jgi:DNA repair protein RAD16